MRVHREHSAAHGSVNVRTLLESGERTTLKDKREESLDSQCDRRSGVPTRQNGETYDALGIK